MKEEYNIISIFKVMKYKKEKKKDGTFPYSGLEVYMGRTTEKGKQYLQ